MDKSKKIICPYCSSANNQAARFCKKCGQSLVSFVPRSVNRTTRWLKRISIVVLSVIGLIFVTAFIYGFVEGVKRSLQEDSGSYTSNHCNIARVPLHGVLTTVSSSDDSDQSTSMYGYYTYSQELTEKLEKLDNDNSFKAIILDVDSPGGTPVAAEEVAQTISRVKKPVVALIRESGNSGAYYASSAADKIYAAVASDVGSIGVTNSYLDNVKKNTQDGLTYQQLSLGLYKDTLDPDKPLTTDERQLVLAHLQATYNQFIKTVAQNRHLTIEDVTKLATGEVFSGQEALDYKLIDAIGGIYDVKDYLATSLNITPEVCWQ